MAIHIFGSVQIEPRRKLDGARFDYPPKLDRVPFVLLMYLYQLFRVFGNRIVVNIIKLKMVMDGSRTGGHSCLIGSKKYSKYICRVLYVLLYLSVNI